MKKNLLETLLPLYNDLMPFKTAKKRDQAQNYLSLIIRKDLFIQFLYLLNYFVPFVPFILRTILYYFVRSFILRSFIEFCTIFYTVLHFCNILVTISYK